MVATRRITGAALAVATCLALAVVAPGTSAAATQAAGTTHPKGARHRVTHGAAPAGATPAVTSAASSSSTGTLLHDFNGVSSRDSEVTNFNQEFEPPDQGLCAGNGYVLEPVNSAYSIYRADGTRVRGPFNVNDLFDEGAAEFTSDPRCYYDSSTHRWFATVLFLNAAFTAGRIDIATSETADPTGLWHQLHINTSTNKHGPGCPCFGDQPRIGIDHDNVYVTTDEFSINGPEFNGAQIYAVDKGDLVDGNADAHVAHFGPLTVAGAPALSVQPALTTGAAPAEFFLSSLDPDGNGDHRIGVWALTHGDRVGRGGKPVLTSKVISSEPYVNPSPAEQKGSSSTIDAGDDRMQQTQFIDGRIWGELSTGTTPPGAAHPRTAAAWFAVRPTVGSSGLTGATVDRQGYVATSGASLLYPAMQADAAGRAAMVFTVTGSTRYPSAGYATLPATGTSFGPVTVAAAGTGPYDKDATRWGDYSFAVLSPTSDAVWLATEYVPPRSSQTTDRARNWGTRVFEVGLH